MKEKNYPVFSYAGIVIITTAVFVLLKLLKVTTWSWLWILCPLWLPLALSVIIAAVGVVICGIKTIVDKTVKHKRSIKDDKA